MEEIAKVFGLNWKLLVIQIINFSTLLFVMWYFLYAPLMNMLEKRRKLIEKGVRDSAEAREKLEEVESQKQEILSEATAEGEDMIASAKKRAEEAGEKRIHESEKRAESILEEATVRAHEEKRRILDEAQDQIAKSAILAAEKILNKR